MDERDVITKHKYFAAANGYDGFVSYFDKVFSSEDYKRIYVLKGGPGTGKSSFMKRMENKLAEDGYQTEAIYCSSDPNSLDGVIAQGSVGQIAIIDGTAPHERDAVIPGAIDEIINLGNSWDKRWLEAQRDKVLLLNNEKSKAYKTAYAYLRLAGTANKEITKVVLQRIDTTSATNSVKSKAESLIQKNGNIKTRLISSFGRYGKREFDTLSEISKSLISITGEQICVSLYLTLLSSALSNLYADFTHFIAPLDSAETEAILIGDIAITHKNKGDDSINANEFLKSIDSLDKERIKLATDIHERALNEAQRWFAIASDIHFRLEEIYSGAMDFNKNNIIFDEKYQEIKNILKSSS